MRPVLGLDLVRDAVEQDVEEPGRLRRLRVAHRWNVRGVGTGHVTTTEYPISNIEYPTIDTESLDIGYWIFNIGYSLWFARILHVIPRRLP